MITNKVKIIRCLWGKQTHQFKEKNLKFYHEECIIAKSNDETHQLKNQIVFVWDEVNRELMEQIEYPYYYMGDSSELETEFNFIYKLYALKKAMELYDEILFLDWDFLITKQLDNNFFKLLKSRWDIQIPLYFYPKELINLFKTMSLEDKSISNYYNNLYDQIINHCEWRFNDGYVIPNAGFIYCRDKRFFDNLLNTQKNYKIRTNIEEICIAKYLNDKITNIDEYIEKIEPLVCHGKIGSEMWGKQEELNEYTLQKLKKEIYFIHK